MKITVYTINDCKFSQAEKEYLKKNNVEFEEKNLETNRDFLTEMLAVSNNFAGTPVTKIEKDSGESMVLKGFTQEEFDKALGIASPTSTQSAQTATVAASSTEMKKEEPAEQSTESSETKPENAVMPATDAVPVTPAAENTAPMAVESLSQDDSSAVTPSDNNEMPTPVAVEPMTPAEPKTNDAIGPISLAGDTTTAGPAPEPTTEPVETADTQPQTPAVPSADASPAAQQQTVAQPPADALNSVLQNLQSQVNSGAPAQDGQKQ